MRDRIPGIGGALPNGAIRYGVYDAEGALLRYEFIKAEDNPTQAGTPLNTANLLKDATAAKLGLQPETAVPDDAINVLYDSTRIQIDHVYTTPAPSKTATQPSTIGNGRTGVSAASNANYAIFAGGSGSSSVEAYDTALVRSVLTSLNQPRDTMGGTSVGNYALFGGGYYNGPQDSVYAYDSSLVRTSPTSLSYARNALAATYVGNYALFGGGTGNNSAAVDAYSSTLVRTQPTSLSQARWNLAATHVGQYAIFGGGTDGLGSVDAYDQSLVRTLPTQLSVARGDLAAATTGGYALFGGGNPLSAVVDAYDTALIRTTAPELVAARYDLSATNIANYALFAGGYNGGNPPVCYASVDAYDADLLHVQTTNLSTAKYGPAATHVGNYALFAGGGSAVGGDANVDAYMPVDTTSFVIPAYSAYRFEGYHNEEQLTFTDTPWFSQGTITGYIRKGFKLSGYQPNLP